MLQHIRAARICDRLSPRRPRSTQFTDREERRYALRSVLVGLRSLSRTWIVTRGKDAAICAEWGYGSDWRDSVGRSGRRLRTDALTGCEYLISADGGLT